MFWKKLEADAETAAASRLELDESLFQYDWISEAKLDEILLA